MKAEKVLIEHVWDFIRLTGKQVVMIEQLGQPTFFIFDDFKPKSRDFFFNEVYGGQDITAIIESFQDHVALQGRSIMEGRLNEIERKSFAFAHDNFIWYKSVVENSKY